MKKSDSKLYVGKKKLLVKITSKKKKAYFLAPAYNKPIGSFRAKTQNEMRYISFLCLVDSIT